MLTVRTQRLPINTLLYMEDMEHFVDAGAISENGWPLQEGTALVLGDEKV